MRDGISNQENGILVIDWSKVIGKGYTRGWYTNCKARYRIFKGARNTKKSKDIMGYEVVHKILNNDKRNILIVRKNDNDNRQTTYENIVGCIEDLGISIGNRSDENVSFVTSTNPLMITYKPTGQKIIFRGMNNPTSLNSLTFSHGYLTDVYIEEAFEIESYDDFRKLDGSLRGKLPDGLTLQITLCFNAWNQSTWLYTEFFKGRLEDDISVLDDPERTFMDYYDPNFVGPYGVGLYLHISTYKINEFRDKEVYDRSAQENKEKVPERYYVEFLGCWGNSTEACYPSFKMSLVKPIDELVGVDKYNQPLYEFADYAIGIDTGLSNGEGKKRIVLKDQKVEERIKSATTMALVAITSDYRKIVVIDEYYHSNVAAFNGMNTDTTDRLKQPQIIDTLVRTLLEWKRIYKIKDMSILMKGTTNCYVDSADLGFRQDMELKARELELYDTDFYASTKMSVQFRVDFYDFLMGYGDILISDRCKNYIREIKSARRGEKGEARSDIDDHMLTGVEYGAQPMIPDLLEYKDFKIR